MKNTVLPLIVLLSASSIQAAVLAVSGTIVSTSPPTSSNVGVAHEGTVVGTFDDVTNELGLTVSFQLGTTLNGTSPGDPSGGVTLSIGNPEVAGSTPITGSFSLVSLAEFFNLTSFSSPLPFAGSPHVVEGTFILSDAEEAALTGGTIFTRINGDDARGIAALTAVAVPEPSTALLSFAGLALLARRCRS